MPGAGVSSALSEKLPSSEVLACASCLGSPALPAHKITVEFATAPPPACTCPLMRTAASAAPHTKPRNPTTPRARALRAGHFWISPCIQSSCDTPFCETCAAARIVEAEKIRADATPLAGPLHCHFAQAPR